VYRGYVSDTATDISRTLQVIIAEEEGLATQEGLDTRDYPIQFAFGQGARDAGSARQIDELWGQTDCAKQNWSSRGTFADLASRVDPILAGHEEIQNYKVRIQLLRLANGVVAVGRFTTDFPVRVIAQEPPETLANDRAVIGNQNPSGHVVSLRSIPSAIRGLRIIWTRQPSNA